MTQHTHFGALGLAPKLLLILEQNKFTTPTPIQALAIPAVLGGNDVIGIAQTGTGKTLAYGLPMIQRLANHQGQGLVVVPTRELALQVEETLRKVGHPIGLKTAVLIGGASMREQLRALHNRPHVIVATPGRLVDHMEQKTLSLSQIKVVVLDEADRMFDIGFAPQIKRILAAVPHERQTLLFSATMPPAILSLAHQYMKRPERIEVAPAGTSAAQIEQAAYIISKEIKLRLLLKLLQENLGTILVFSRTKHGARKIARSLKLANHAAVEIHSDRSLAQRKSALAGFKNGTHRILVATDIAARGIDVTGISLVINYDLPDNSEDYVHRIGRTGRAGHHGRAVSFVGLDQRSDLKAIERLIRKPVPIIALPGIPSDLPMPPVDHSASHQGPPGRNFGHNAHRRPPSHRPRFHR